MYDHSVLICAGIFKCRNLQGDIFLSRGPCILFMAGSWWLEFISYFFGSAVLRILRRWILQRVGRVVLKTTPIVCVVRIAIGWKIGMKISLFGVMMTLLIVFSEIFRT